MLRRKTVFLCAFAALLAAFPVKSLACACCAEPGTYFLRTSKPDQFYLDLLGDMTFQKPADLYMTEAGFEMIKGLDPIKKEYEADTWTASSHFDLVASFTNKLWRFNIKTPKGMAGTIVLPLPTQMVTYKVDIHDEENRPNGPNLYKELRFKGAIPSATGMFRAAAVRGSTYFLVFQGRGNGCDNASDFKDWRLEISGPRSDYVFFGKLNSEAAEKLEMSK